MRHQADTTNESNRLHHKSGTSSPEKYGMPFGKVPIFSFSLLCTASNPIQSFVSCGQTSTASVLVRTNEDAELSPVLLPFIFWKFGEKAFDVRLQFGDRVPLAGRKSAGSTQERLMLFERCSLESSPRVIYLINDENPPSEEDPAIATSEKSCQHGTENTNAARD